jgi:hypothetical protein
MARRDEFIQIAKTVPYDDQNIPTNLGPDVQTALDNIYYKLGNSSSPGFTYGRSGTLPSSTWLLADTVPCNLSGRVNFLNNCKIVRIVSANQVADVIKIGVYSHDGDEVNLTLLATVTTAATKTNIFTVSVSVPYNKQLAVRVEPNSPSSGKNMEVGLLLNGDLV